MTNKITEAMENLLGQTLKAAADAEAAGHPELAEPARVFVKTAREILNCIYDQLTTETSNEADATAEAADDAGPEAEVNKCICSADADEPDKEITSKDSVGAAETKEKGIDELEFKFERCTFNFNIY